MAGVDGYALAVIAIALAAASPGAYAIRSQVSLGAGLDYSDNATFAETDTESELARVALIGVSATERSSAVTADLRSLVEYRSYQQEIYDDETLFNLRGTLDWEILPNRLNWVVGDYFSQETPDIRAPETPTNRVNANAFTTGPDLAFRLGAVDTLTLSGRYADYYFEENAADSQRGLVSMNWAHRLAEVGEISATIGHEDVDYTETASDDFKRDELFVSYVDTRVHSTFDVDAGVSFIDRSAEEDITGFLGRVRWTRELGTTSYFEVVGYSQYTDSGLNLLTVGELDEALQLDSEQLSTDVFYDKRVEASYHRGTAGRSLTLSAFARDEDFEEETFNDRTSFGGRIEGDRALMPRLTGNAFASYRRTKYVFDDTVQKDTAAGVGVDYRLSRKLTLAFDIIHNIRHSSGLGTDYDENRVLLLLYYGVDPYLYR